MDFFTIKERKDRNGKIEIYPDFRVIRSNDLMIKGKSFYAIWDEEKNLWSTDEYDVQRIVDSELKKRYDKLIEEGKECYARYMSSFSSKSWTEYKNYISKLSDSYINLDSNIVFSNTETFKEDYISKRLSYPLMCDDICESYNELMNVLYSPEERAKIEWAIGSIFVGDSKIIQKFLVFYGPPKSGKSTVLNIIQKLFESYCSTFEADALASSNNQFSTEVFRNNPLVAIQHDGDLSKIEDNTKLNSIISHEDMIVHEKYKQAYTSRINCFLFIGTNKPVKITDAKSGIIRRLIDVNPTGDKIPPERYIQLMQRIEFELGSIAYHCINVYKSMGRFYYDGYRPLSMIFQTDVFFNFVESYYYDFAESDGITLSKAYDMYKEYCDESLVQYKLPRYKFREELKNYFTNFYDITRIDGKQYRSYYSGFIKEKFESIIIKNMEEINEIKLDFKDSILDDMYSECIAQYSNENGKPNKTWDKVTTKLKDLDTSKTHYLLPPKNHIVIDFDLKDENGNKSLKLNLQEATKWPATYMEISNGGNGIHAHYIYEGDVGELSNVYSKDIEIKTFSGLSSLRRRRILSNNLPISVINHGLPKKKVKKVIDFKIFSNEQAIKTMIQKNINKEYHKNTKPSIDFIYKILDDAYNSGMVYDVSDLRTKVQRFAMRSTNQPEECLRIVSKMQFKSKTDNDNIEFKDDSPIVFFDVEVFPNLFVICLKEMNKEDIISMVNPTKDEVKDLFGMKLVGFNNRRYDNHILYYSAKGYTNKELFEISKRIVGKGEGFAREAYNISYTDVYDFASAGNKKSLKAWQIELRIHHQENEYEWDEPVPEDKWNEIVEYCSNDVKATEKVFKYIESDWIARQIIADIAGMTVNDTTNTLSKRIVFGRNKTPQKDFMYRNLADPVKVLPSDVYDFLNKHYPLMMKDRHGDENSILPYFPGYVYEHGKSLYKGVDVGNGGYVKAIYGMYYNVALLDVASMHPTSICAECLFGVEYTSIFKEILDGRLDIKTKNFETINDILGGKLTKYVDKIISGEISNKSLANALKTVLNSFYGLTAASFENEARDSRNIDNIVAKRGALFMVDLWEAVEKEGYKPIHIKTDSIKIANADDYIIEFVMNFGKRYGYTFEHEATYEKMCLINDAVYIEYHDGKWSATGKQFSEPYVFKRLFSKEKIDIYDTSEVFNVSTSLYLDNNESLKEDEHNYLFVGRIGQFCPVNKGTGGGLLLRKNNDGSYSFPSGSKGYRWKQTEIIKEMGLENEIDLSYYNNKIDDAISAISKYGDIEWFLNGEESIIDYPPWCEQCGKDCLNCDGCDDKEKDDLKLPFEEELL